MDALAEALLELNWSDMDEFAQHINLTLLNNDEMPSDEIGPREISENLIDWAHENRATDD